MYVVKMDGHRVRQFKNKNVACRWAAKHCHGQIEIVSLSECSGLPQASRRIFPNEDMPNLVYKPFISLG